MFDNNRVPNEFGNNTAPNKLVQTFTKVKAWASTHKPQTVSIVVAIALALVAGGVGIAYATGAFAPANGKPAVETATDEAQTADLTLNVTADKGWDENSTPAIAHIVGAEGTDTADVDFYHAVTPDAEGNSGSSTVALAEGDYTVSFVSPVNSDGSAYEVYDTGEAQDVTVDADAEEAPAIDCPMTQIPAEQVTDEMLQGIIDETKDAVANGDETLKGEAGQAVLDKLEGNVSANPNATDETKQEATDADSEVDVNGAPAQTTPPATGNADNAGSASTGGTSGSNAGNTGNSGNGSASQPSAPAHQHSWVNHTATRQVWVPNIVTVPDYETQKVPVGVRYIFAYDGYTTTSQADAEAHMTELLLAGLPENYRNETVYETQQVQVGSHTEDHGHYENESYVDYVYCSSCGARQ